MHKIKLALWILFSLGLVVVFLLVGLPVLNKVIAYERENRDYTLHTTPLKSEVIRDICEKFEISDEDPRCIPGAKVYAPEFFADIKAFIRSLPQEKANAEEVQRLLGEYEVYREPITRLNDGTEYFTITFDLRGDSVYPIDVWFTGNGTFKKIMANAGGS